MPALLAVVLCAVAAMPLTLLMIRVGVADVPNARSSHAAPTPRGGGVAVVTATLVGFGLWGAPHWALAAALAALLALGLWDDVKGARPAPKLAIQALVCAGFAWAAAPGWAAFALALWLLFFVNAFNFMDGANGMAGLTAAVGAAALALAGGPFVAAAALCLLGGVLGFLPFNFPRARIFLGDAGSLPIGFALAALAGLATLDGRPVWFAPALFLTFAFDVALTLARRALRGERLTEAHRDHLYQLLLRLGWPHGRVSGTYAAAALLNGAVALSGSAAAFAALLAAHAAFAWLVLAAARRKLA